jgi:hypothetical protein
MDEKSSSLEWSSHLISQYPAKGVILIAITVLFTILMWILFEHWLYPVISAVVLFLSTMRYYFPVRYRLGEDGVRRWFLGFEKFRPWTDFRNVYVHKDGLFLAPFEKPSRLDAFRGLGINFGQNRDSIVAFVREKLNLA